MVQDNNVLFIIGPTAVGKSKLAIDIAKNLGGEVISADSMQVYKGMDIGTAKPTRAELRSVPHHLINIISPDKPWSVSDFVNRVKTLVRKIIKKGKVPMIVGGTGLYINSLLEGYSFPVIKNDEKIRGMLEEEARLYGSRMLHERLKDVDAESAAKIHPNDKKRVIRALEVYEITGKPMSLLKEKGKSVLPVEPLIIGLDMDRDKLYKKIEKRIDGMMSAGLVKEVERLLKKGYDRRLNSMQAIGYKEVVAHLHDGIAYEKMVDQLKQNTRNFAKRQMTWFKRFRHVNWFDVDKLKLSDIIRLIKARD